MPLITDKFGKASVNSDVAIATTVKTTRSAGISVLEAIDLSKYAPDTPVFVVTYKKTTDPLTGVATITQLRSWKALVNVGANTLTNLTIQPGYADDIGNAVGDFIECIPTSAWENSLIDGILTSLNPDGTLKTSAVQTALNLGSSSLNGWNVLGYTPSTIVDNGNRNYTVTILGVDKTDTLSPGTRLMGVRAVTAPTYMAGIFNGTTHYLTKVTPSGTLSTVTDNITMMAHAMPTSYGSTKMYLCGRGDGTAANAFGMFMDVAGKVGVLIANGGAGNLRYQSTSTSLPLNRKTHVAATWAAGVVNVYFDGVLQPMTAVSTGGTAPTVAGLGGDWSIGRLGASGSTYFPGYLGGVGIFNAVLSQATIRSYKNQVLGGAETNNIGAWSLNNVLTDANAAGNNLTNPNAVAMASGVAPYCTNGFNVSTGDKDFGIVMTSTFTGGNTVMDVHVAEGCAFTTTGSYSSIQYSGVGKPYGFPSEKYKWRVQSVYVNGAGGYFNTGSTTFLRAQTLMNIGLWDVGYEVEINQTTATATVHNCVYGLSTSSGVNPDRKDPLTTSGTIVNLNEYYPCIKKTYPGMRIGVAATYYLNAQPIGTTFAALGLRTDLVSTIYADNGYL